MKEHFKKMNEIKDELLRSALANSSLVFKDSKPSTSRSTKQSHQAMKSISSNSSQKNQLKVRDSQNLIMTIEHEEEEEESSHQFVN